MHINIEVEIIIILTEVEIIYYDQHIGNSSILTEFNTILIVDDFISVFIVQYILLVSLIIKVYIYNERAIPKQNIASHSLSKNPQIPLQPNNTKIHKKSNAGDEPLSKFSFKMVVVDQRLKRYNNIAA